MSSLSDIGGLSVDLSSKINELPTKLRSKQNELFAPEVWVGQASENADRKIEEIITSLSDLANQMTLLKKLIPFLNQYENLTVSRSTKKADLAALQLDTITNANAIGSLEKEIYTIDAEMSAVKAAIYNITGN